MNYAFRRMRENCFIYPVSKCQCYSAARRFGFEPYIGLAKAENVVGATFDNVSGRSKSFLFCVL
jgi:hypothetical protein